MRWNAVRGPSLRPPSIDQHAPGAGALFQRVPARVVHYALALLLLVTGLAYALAALAAQLAQPANQVDQVVELDWLEWGRAGTLATGVLLLFVARALARGKRHAWLLSLLMLALSFAGEINERAGWRSLVVTGAVLVVLLAVAPFFSTRSDRWASVRGYIALAAGGWLTWGHAFILHLRRIGHLVLPHGSTRLILAPMKLTAYALLTYGLWQLLRPVLTARRCAREERERAAAVVREWGHLSTAHFALGRDKSYFWSESGRSLIPYRVAWGVALTLADPIGPDDERAALLDAFLAFCRRQDWTVALYQVSGDVRTYCRARSLAAFKIGEDALVDLGAFTLAGKVGAPVRHAVARARRGGVSVRVYHQEALPAADFAGMKRVSAAWLGKRSVANQFSFSMGRFPTDWSPDLLTAVAYDAAGEACAFVTWTPLYAGNGWALDNMRRDTTTEPGTMELLLAESIAWAHARGAERMTLGLVPLAGMSSVAGGEALPEAVSAATAATALERLATTLHRRGMLLGNYRSLYFFKDKFQPVWEPRYLAVSDLGALPLALWALATVMSGGWRGVAREAWQGVLGALPRPAAATAAR
jgi:phosphatidylglycerol lysyltransferase